MDKDAPVALGCAFLVIFAVATAWLLKRQQETGLLALIAVPSLLMSFKHAFIRQDAGHEWMFFFWCLFVVASIGLASPRREWKPVLIAFAALCALASVPFARSGISVAWVEQSLNPMTHIQQMCALANGELVKDLDRQTVKNCQTYKLPADAVKRIRAAGNPPVALLPACIGYTATDNLNWEPFPTVHFCHAETPYLDKWCSQHYSNSHGPRFIVFGSTEDLTWNFGEIDYRIPTLEAPLTCNAIYCNYEVVASYKSPEALLLERRTSPRLLDVRTLKAEHQQLNKWFLLPRSSEPLIAYIHLHPKPLQYALSKVYQLPPIMLDVASSDSWRTFRLVPANLESGLMLNCFPRNITELGEWMSGKNPNRVCGIRISGPGCGAFQRDYDITWSVAKFTPGFNSSSR